MPAWAHSNDTAEYVFCLNVVQEYASMHMCYKWGFLFLFNQSIIKLLCRLMDPKIPNPLDLN